MLSNGQAFVMHTFYAGRFCASELIFREKAGSSPMALVIQGAYPKFLRQTDSEQYDTHVFRNSFDTPVFGPDDTRLLRAQKADGSPLDLPRFFDKTGLNPLTKEAYNDLIQTAGNDLAGVKNDDEFMKKLQLTPEFWIIAAVAGVATYYALLRQFHIPFYFAGIIGYITSAFFTTKIIMYKEELALLGTETWWMRASTHFTRMCSLTRFYVLSLGCSIAATWLPVYILKGSGKLTNLYGVAQATTPALLLVDIVLVSALVCALTGKRRLQIVSGVLGLASTGLILLANSITDMSGKKPTPEPQTTIVIVLAMLVALLGISVIVQKTKSLKPELPAR